MDKPQFVYVTYIAAFAEDVWNAIIDPKITVKYWQYVNLSDWKVGSKWEQRDGGRDGNVHLAGKIVEVSRPKRLVITWAFPQDITNEERTSRVTFTIE